MADGAITAVPLQDDAAPARRVARLSGQRVWDGAIDKTIGHELVVTMGYAAQGDCYEYSCQQHPPHGAQPQSGVTRGVTYLAHAKTSAVILAYHDRAYSASRTRISSGASTGLMPSEPSTATILSPTT